MQHKSTNILSSAMTTFDRKIELTPMGQGAVIELTKYACGCSNMGMFRDSCKEHEGIVRYINSIKKKIRNVIAHNHLHSSFPINWWVVEMCIMRVLSTTSMKHEDTVIRLTPYEIAECLCNACPGSSTSPQVIYADYVQCGELVTPFFYANMHEYLQDSLHIKLDAM